ncbi:UNVERIFIED_CONTAM: hypothetical protein Sradi_4886600 [Sesamum radiatum]|uniref:DUF4283 domain-containing protein n=1 Tax=Sesamum radiatum TaxID=300843 RepID=A0AAW2MBU4_SESRA
MASFTLNPDDFPPLTSTNPSESTHTNSAKTTSFGKALNTESADRHSANRLANDSIFSKFFLANSNPPPIGATHNINGRPTVIFSDAETQSLVANFRFSLIGKFSQGIPPFSQLHRLLAKSGIKGAFTVSLINYKHALISLSNESDFTRLWLRRIWYLNGFPMRVFKWSPTFTPEQESSIIPIWVNFLELLAHLFRKDALFAIANNIGTLLQIADSTLNQSNLAKARVCVEIDILKPLLKEIDLKICGATIVQNIVYEHIPNYCSLCKHVGHYDAECYSKGDAPKAPPHRQKAGKIYKMKGKAVAQDVYKVFDKMPEKSEAGECSKNTTDITGMPLRLCLTLQRKLWMLKMTYVLLKMMPLSLLMQKNDAVVANELEEVQNLIEFNAENETVNSPNYAVNTDNESCRKGDEKKNFPVVVETENDVAIDVEMEDQLHVAHEKEPDNLLLDSTINVETGGSDVEKTVGVITTRPNYFIGDLWRGKRWISAENAVRLVQNLKWFGMVFKGIKEDVEDLIKKNRLAVQSAIRYRKCILLFDPIRQLYLQPLDTSSQLEIFLVDFGGFLLQIWTGNGEIFGWNLAFLGCNFCWVDDITGAAASGPESRLMCWSWTGRVGRGRWTWDGLAQLIVGWVELGRSLMGWSMLDWRDWTPVRWAGLDLAVGFARLQRAGPARDGLQTGLGGSGLCSCLMDWAVAGLPSGLQMLDRNWADGRIAGLLLQAAGLRWAVSVRWAACVWTLRRWA